MKESQRQFDTEQKKINLKRANAKINEGLYKRIERLTCSDFESHLACPAVHGRESWSSSAPYRLNMFHPKSWNSSFFWLSINSSSASFVTFSLSSRLRLLHVYAVCPLPIPPWLKDDRGVPSLFYIIPWDRKFPERFIRMSEMMTFHILIRKRKKRSVSVRNRMAGMCSMAVTIYLRRACFYLYHSQNKPKENWKKNHCLQ